MEPRLQARKQLICQQIESAQSVTINRFAPDSKSRRGAERFLYNKQVKNQELLDDLLQPLASSSTKQGAHVAIFQDTCVYSFESRLKQGQSSRFKQDDPHIGDLHKSGGKGINAHIGLAIDLRTKLPIGLAGCDLYVNKPKESDKKDRNYKQLDTAAKASQRWIDLPKQAIALFKEATRVTIVADREADMYSLLAYPFDDRVDVVVRLSQDRQLDPINKGKMLFAHLDKQSWSHDFIAAVRKDQGGYQKQDVPFQLRFTTIELPRPSKLSIADKAIYARTRTVTVVEACQSGPVAKESDRIHWYLYATAPVDTIEQALAILEIYLQRWWIEDFFRLTKSKGFRMEESGVEDGLALQRLLLLMLGRAVKVLTLRQGRLREDQLASDHLDAAEIAVLHAIHPRHQRVKGDGHLCPYPKDTLPWAVWLIAYLGGWNGRTFDKRPPGVVTLHHGYIRLQDLVLGYQLMKTSSS